MAMIRHPRLHGLVAAAHTPFHPDHSLAPEVVSLQAEHLAKHGVRCVFVTGSTGESHSLTRGERIRIYEAWAQAAPSEGLRVIAHVGSNCIEDARYFASAAAEYRFSAISALAPSYFKPADCAMLVDCCASIASAAPDLPFYYYDIPSMTGVRFDMREFLPLAANRIPNLAGIKFTNNDPGMYRDCLGFEDGRFDIPWGIDEKLVTALGVGAKGAVGSTYNFAAPLYQELIAAFEGGDVERAAELQKESVWLVDQLAAVGYFGAAKALMDWLGVPVGPARMPLGNPDKRQLADLRAKLADFRWFGSSWQGAAAGSTAEMKSLAH